MPRLDIHEASLGDMVHPGLICREEQVGLVPRFDLPREVVRSAEVKDQVRASGFLAGRCELLEDIAKARGSVEVDLGGYRPRRRSPHQHTLKQYQYNDRRPQAMGYLHLRSSCLEVHCRLDCWIAGLYITKYDVHE